LLPSGDMARKETIPWSGGANSNRTEAASTDGFWRNCRKASAAAATRNTTAAPQATFADIHGAELAAFDVAASGAASNNNSESPISRRAFLWIFLQAAFQQAAKLSGHLAQVRLILYNPMREFR